MVVGKRYKERRDCKDCKTETKTYKAADLLLRGGRWYYAEGRAYIIALGSLSYEKDF